MLGNGATAITLQPCMSPELDGDADRCPRAGSLFMPCPPANTTAKMPPSPLLYTRSRCAMACPPWEPGTAFQGANLQEGLGKRRNHSFQESTCVPGRCQDSPLLWFTLWRSRDPGRQCCQLLGIWGSWQLSINANTSERDPAKRCTSKSGGCLARAEGNQLKYLECQRECERVFFPCLWWSWGHCLISINITQRVLRNLCMVLDPAWHWVLPWRCWRAGRMATAADLLPHYCLGSGKVGKGGWLKGVGREEEKGKKR